jgi:signal transduction histidine kinase
MKLDPFTIWVALGFISTIIPIFVWLALRGQGGVNVSLWTLGAIGIGVSITLIGLRPIFPEWFGFTFSFGCLLYGLAFQCAAYRLLTVNVLELKRLLLFATLLLFTYAISKHILENQLITFYIGSISLILGYGYITFQISKINHSLRSITQMRWVFLTLSVVLILRLLLTLISRELNNINVLDTNIFLSYLSFCIVAFILPYQFIQYYSESRELNAINSLKDQIYLLDRHRSASLLASSFSHELSQPITTALLEVEELKNKVNRDYSTKSADLNEIKQIESALIHASKIIVNLRNYVSARKENIEKVILLDIVRIVLEMLRMPIKKADISIDIDVADEYVILFSKTELVQILLNLLRNSIAATSSVSNKRVIVSISDEGNYINLQVKDTGRGLPDNFKMQGSSGLITTTEGGTGIGLMVVASIVEKYRGYFRIENDTDGVIASVRLPKSLLVSA